MSRPLPVALLLGLLVATFGCGKLKVVNVPSPDEEEDARDATPATARPVSESAWASQLAFEACRSEIAKRWRVSETKVRTSTRAHDAREGIDLVNWEVQSGAAGYCRVDSRGAVLSVETERSPGAPSRVATDPPPPVPALSPAPAPAPAPTPAAPDRGLEGEDTEPPQVKKEQLDACRETVVREMRARADDVGLSAGSPDEHGTVLVDWSLGTGREGTCLVDAAAAVVQFRRGTPDQNVAPIEK